MGLDNKQINKKQKIKNKTNKIIKKPSDACLTWVNIQELFATFESSLDFFVIKKKEDRKKN